ncbi:MAG TPA: DUF1659 domain-containing protein [Candidatus Avacidaminococcus intestinavium]|uniref:DUF1659 domain-containing protein n=1 Tax=Candidatus Avacidaminococcus intestinavium TaxID=2840684 RepID=A0A9D1SL50_9FIRM|nr:DUF1659 domain-containing protein [Candidatus Avacidaminococcus intestinavium]
MTKKSIEKISLNIQVDNGINSKGAAVSKTYSFGNVKTNVEADQLLNAANAIAGLYGHALQNIFCTEKCLLSAE